MIRRVAVPIIYSTVRLHLEKGRRWSVAEHLLLYALSEGENTAEELARQSGLHPRMVVQALVNLMRVGWVEILVTGERVRFAITTGGSAHVGKEELPVITEPVTKDLKFAVDQVLGRVLRWRALTFVPSNRFERLRDDEMVVLPPRKGLGNARLADIIESLLDADETHRGSDTSAARPGEGWLIATVAGDKVEGLPRDVPDLKRLVVAACEAAGDGDAGAGTVPAEPKAGNAGRLERQIHVAAQDIVSGDVAHRDHLLATIAAARSWVAIHSTFVRPEPFLEILPHIQRAAREHGVRTDVFWGKGDQRDPDAGSRRIVEGYRAEVAARDLQQFVKIHPFSTGSHAKILLADDGRGRMQATIGSANWLYTDFSSFEVSVRLADGPIVADVMDALADMAYVATGNWSGVPLDLAGRARAAMADAGRRTGRRVTARLLLGDDHVSMFEAARDRARRQIVIASHRLGAAAENMALAPVRAAAEDRGVDALVYYSTPSDRVTAEIAAGMRFKAEREGVRLRQVTDPRMHAKFMLWDDDDLVVTSQNLLSGDPGEGAGEIGVHLHGAGVGRDLLDRVRLRFPS